MEKENKLEKEVKRFDWKEWIPIYGFYKVPRDIMRGEDSLPNITLTLLNGVYHGFIPPLIIGGIIEFEQFIQSYSF